jgi:uncharacterized Rmd1/YagE family protein
MQIGELFILRINIHLQGSVLDAPELMWAEPQLEPVYQAVRSYLEMDQRVGLLTERLDVIADLLQVLKDQLTHTHGTLRLFYFDALISNQLIIHQASTSNGSSSFSSPLKSSSQPSTSSLTCMQA